MNKTKIEWTDYTWNPFTGCTNNCPYCYARKICERYGWSFKPTFHPDRLREPLKVKKPSKIFADSMSDMLIHAPIQIIQVQDIMELAHWHTFQILTKRPELAEQIDWLFPSNCWVGVTVDEQSAVTRIPLLREARAFRNCLKFVSFEPLRERVLVSLRGIDWVIIGAQTNPYRKVPLGWMDDILREAAICRIPVFMKNNLHYPLLRQEFPAPRVEASA